MVETMGPGAYSPERGDALTKPKMANVNMGSSPARGSFKPRTDSVGPGQYDDGKTFGSETKTFIIGEKRAERIVETMGPGAYSPERGDALTKTKTANINMGSSPARASIVKTTGIDIAPGQYDDRSYEMSKSKKTFTIGEKRAERIVESMGPGAYSPERGDALTKSKMANVNFGTSESRATIVRKGDDVGPGMYEDSKQFGSETKTFTIGEKRSERVVESMGPGAYSPERAETITKTRTATVNMGSSPARASIVKTTGVDLAPGQYDDRSYEMSMSKKNFTIGEKRADRIVETMGPGAYSPERAETITKTRTATVNMGSSPARASIVKTTGIDIAPGQYDDRTYEISNSKKGFIIGEKRAERVVETMGPGAYSPERGDALTKTRSANINMGSSPARASMIKKTDIDIAPG